MSRRPTLGSPRGRRWRGYRRSLLPRSCMGRVSKWRRRRMSVVLGRKFYQAVLHILRWGTSQLEPTPHPANLSHMVLAFLPLQLSLRHSSPHPSSPHRGFPFPFISLARYLPPTGWFVEAAKCGDLLFLSGLPSSWRKIAARCLHIWTLWFITHVFFTSFLIHLIAINGKTGKSY